MDPPAVSVVVASCRAQPLLDACLAALLPQCARHRAGLVVARAGSVAELDALRHGYPGVRVVPAHAHATLPELRAIGLAAADGEIVALTEDHCVAASDWLDQLVTAGTTHEVVGGSLDNARTDRRTDWAAFFAEYGPYSLGTAADGTPAMASANVAYRRSVIDEVVALAAAGEWENVVHRTLADRGHTFAFRRTAAVRENAAHDFWDFCRNRFAHGRAFALRRLAEERAARRWMLLAGSWMLPVVLTWRVSRAVERRHRRAFVRALPITFVFLTAWSAGEAWGYLIGPVREQSRRA